jgi:hypothetical protein
MIFGETKSIRRCFTPNKLRMPLSIHQFSLDRLFSLPRSTRYFLLAGALGGLLFIGQDAFAQKNGPPLKIGDAAIENSDINYEIAVELCYGDTAVTKEQAVVELGNKTLEKEVLRIAYGQIAPKAALKQKADYIDQTSRDPERLACLKQIFGKDTAAYYRLIVEPTLVNPRLRAYFAVDTNVHRAERDSVQKIWNGIIHRPETFSKLHCDTLKISKFTGVQKMPGGHDEEIPVDPLVDRVLSNMKQGDLWHNVIEDDHGYRILMLLKVTDSVYTCRVFTVEKKPFDAWFREFVIYKVPILFRDDVLELSTRLKYLRLWWLQL